MAVLVKSGQVHGLNENNVMPFWWMTEQMRLQFPREQVMVGGMDMDLLKRMGNANNFIRYCPQCAAPQKKGRPHNSTRIKGPLEVSDSNKGGQGVARGRYGGRGEEVGGQGRGHGHGRGRGCGVRGENEVVENADELFDEIGDENEDGMSGSV